MQNANVTSVQAPSPPSPPAPPAPPAPVSGIAVPGGDGTVQVIPVTRGQRRMLERRRDELSRQLNSASERRNELVSQLEEQSGAARAGMEQRIIQLDDRILKLEQQIEENGRALVYSSTSSDVEEAVVASGSSQPAVGPFTQKQATAVSIVGTIFVLFPLAMAACYRIVTRPKRAVESPALQDAAQRLSRLETAVDTIAVEVERMTEGQRFMTRLMTEGRMPGAASQPAAAGEAPALAAGQRPMEPVRVRQAETA